MLRATHVNKFVDEYKRAEATVAKQEAEGSELEQMTMITMVGQRAYRCDQFRLNQFIIIAITAITAPPTNVHIFNRLLLLASALALLFNLFGLLQSEMGQIEPRWTRNAK